MKTRHYLKRIKQKQNETQKVCSFVFHCSGLTSHQWRHLKNVFYIESKGSYQTRHKSGPLCFLSTQVYKQNQSFLKIDRYDKLELFSKPICDLFSESAGHFKTLEQDAEIPLVKSLSSQSQNRLISHTQNPSPTLVNLSRLFTKVNSLEGIHMMLLYGQIDSSLLNHTDIQACPGWSMRFGSSIESNARGVLGLFFQSCFLDVQVLTHSLSTYSSQIRAKAEAREDA